MALTSSVASIITKNRQFSVRRNWNNSSTNQNNENETTLAFVLTKALPKDVQKMIFDQLLMDAKDYGHFWALALSQLENPHLLSKADIESTILSDQCIQPLKSLSILHCLQVSFFFSHHNIYYKYISSQFMIFGTTIAKLLAWSM